MTTGARVYADYNATSPIGGEVVRVMTRCQRECFGNPSAIHREGAAARHAIERARRVVARLINARTPENVVFTSGGTEANNLVLRGLAGGRVPHIIVSAAEHKAILVPAQELAAGGHAEVTMLPVDGNARVQPSALADALRPDTALVSIMLANNEVGSINDIKHLAGLTHARSKAFFHTDAVQCAGKLPLDVQSLGVDLMSFSGHKCGGPKGVGALYLREGVELKPVISGGGQEMHLRGGTENVPAIVGFAEALSLAWAEMQSECEQLEKLREELWTRIRGIYPTALRNTPFEQTLANTLNVSLPPHESRRMVASLDAEGVACSAGSACTSAAAEYSHVLIAMGFSAERCASALRFSFGRESTAFDVEHIENALKNATISASGNLRTVS